MVNWCIGCENIQCAVASNVPPIPFCAFLFASRDPLADCLISGLKLILGEYYVCNVCCLKCP